MANEISYKIKSFSGGEVTDVTNIYTAVDNKRCSAMDTLANPSDGTVATISCTSQGDNMPGLCEKKSCVADDLKSSCSFPFMYDMLSHR